jgi:catechol 2,3-dioxygenase-like lactoylglutathione lyase family enzyme
MVMLRARNPRETAEYYIASLGFSLDHEIDDEVALEGYGFQLVFSRGTGAEREAPPTADDAELSILVPMAVMEAAWERDRARLGDVRGPILGDTGSFVYVSLDPAGNAVALLSPLPGSGFGGRRPTTQRLRRID